MCDYKNHRTKSGTPVIVHEGERILSRAQTKVLATAERDGRVKLPAGGILPQKITKAESAKMLRHYINGTRRGVKAPVKAKGATKKAKPAVKKAVRGLPKVGGFFGGGLANAEEFMRRFG
tara:strand:- start:319 stop:678 length:360 start_codon:yes stop_codon:yes gene_type:complete